MSSLAYQDEMPTEMLDSVDVYLLKKDRVVPDVMIVCDKDIIKRNGINGAPDLIVEVVSPSTCFFKLLLW